MRRWTAAAAVLAAAAALSSGAAPWLQALAGAFLPPDFAQDLAAARVVFSGLDPYQVGIAAEHARIMDATPDIGYRFFPHPPLVVGLSALFAPLELRQAALIWFVVSLGLLVVLAAVIADALGGTAVAANTARRSQATVLIVFAALLAWPPVLYNLEKGQWSILVAVLLALSWHWYRRSHSCLAGTCVGFATAIKLFPVLLAAYLLLRVPRAAAWAGAIVLAALVLPLAVMGPETVTAFLHQSRANLEYWETWPAVTYSVHGAVTRALVGGEWARPFAHAPLLARGLELAVGVLFVALAVVVTRRRRTDGGREGAVYAAWTILLVTLNPLAMGHNGVMLALPIALVGLALADDRRVWPRLAWAAGIGLVSLPRQVLVPAPTVAVGPWEGVVLVALPLWGTLLLFVAAIATSSAGVGERSSLSSPRESGSLPRDVYVLSGEPVTPHELGRKT